MLNLFNWKREFVEQLIALIALKLYVSAFVKLVKMKKQKTVSFFLLLLLACTMMLMNAYGIFDNQIILKSNNFEIYLFVFIFQNELAKVH